MAWQSQLLLYTESVSPGAVLDVSYTGWWFKSCYSSSESSPKSSGNTLRLVVLRDADLRDNVVASIGEQRVGCPGCLRRRSASW